MQFKVDAIQSKGPTIKWGWCLIPPSTQPPPTGGRRRGSCRAVSLRVSPGRPWCRGHCRPSCPGPARASSSSEPAETENPRRRSSSTRSSCWPPTWKTSDRLDNVLSVVGGDVSPRRAVPGLAFSPDAEVVHRLWPGLCVAVHVVHLNAIVAYARDEGLGHSWETVTPKMGKSL